MEQNKPVGIWIRVSTEDQAKGESPEHHERRARLYAEAKGWDVCTVYHLEAHSGKSVASYPETKRMLSDIKSGAITGLIFSKLARLARNTKELLEFADYFKECEADLISLQEAIDTSSPAGRLFYTMIAAMAQWEREEIASRIQASVPIRAKMGKSLGGFATYGYKWEGKQLVIDEKEAPVRVLIYELFLKHKRRKAVATELNKLGYRTRNGSNFSDTVIHRMITDTTAKGERITNHTAHVGHNRQKIVKPKEEWITVSCPSIVSEDLWLECNRILNEQMRKKAPMGPRPVHLLSGYLFCSCGQKMYVYHQNEKYNCKKCKNTIPAQDIDEIFHSQLKSYLLSDSDISNYLEQSDQTVKDKEQLLGVVTTEVSKLRKEMNVYVQMRVSGEMSPENFKLNYKPIEERVAQLEEQLPELQSEVDFLKIQYLSSDTIIRDAQDLYERWLSLSFEEKRSIIETITEKITIDKDEISIALSYFPSSFQNAGKGQQTL